MDKLVKITIILTALSSSVFSSPSQLFYEKVISDGENIVHVEPILDVDNELSGFIYTDSTNGQLIYDNFESDQYLTIEIGGKIFKTIHTVSENHDSLYIYTLDIALSQSPRLYKITVTNSSAKKEELIFPISSIYMRNITHADLNLFDNNIYVEISYFQFSGQPDNYSADNVSKTYVVKNDKYAIDTVYQERTVREGHFVNQFSNDKFYLSEIISTGYSPSLGYFDNAYEYQELLSESDEFIAGTYSDTGKTYSFFIDNFAPSSLTDELIIHANSSGLLEYYDNENHIACYSFGDGIPIELWYNNEVNGIDFSFVYYTKDILVGVRDSQEIIMLNYLNGQISDSSFLDGKLSCIQFFETGLDQPLLNLVGMSADTVKVYRFDIATYITEPSSKEELPQTFTLFQNHPNPFNGETRLEFSNTENQYLKLSVFNILGQEIKILAAAKFSPGTYSFYWDGYDSHGLSQSTGIYFARLESKTSSSMIKLIYLK